MKHEEIKKSQEGITNIPEIVKNSARLYPDRQAFTSVDGTNYNYTELAQATAFVATMVSSAGLGKGDKIAILGENSPHWNIAYFGLSSTGATAVPILPDFRAKEICTILEHAEAKSLFVSGKMLSRVCDVLPKEIEIVFNIDDFSVLDIVDGKIQAPAKKEGWLTKPELSDKYSLEQEGFCDAKPGDLASIIYTSGTTGRSKGVMLSHDNIVFDTKGSATVHQVLHTDRFLSVLPLAHAYEFTIGMLVSVINGAMVHYIDKAPTAAVLTPLLPKLKPTTMLTVPLIIEKIYRSKVKPTLTKSALMRTLMKFGPTRKLLSRLACKKLQAFFGGEIRFFGVGGAALAPDVERFLLDGKFPYAVGYGLTETAPMSAGFDPAGAIFRSIGKAMGGVDIRIDNPDPVTKEGEIVISGRNVMQGYYKDPERTKEAFTADGYFRSGDLGIMDKRGVIYIKGRSKNMILGANGENIYPEEIEAVINSRALVNDSLVMQYKGKLVARVHLNTEALEEKLQHLKENAAEFQKQLQIRIDEALKELMVHVNEHVARNSKLQLIIRQKQPFEKTPTHKIKRFLYKKQND